MSGTSSGGQLAAEQVRRMYGSDFYSRIGAIGGSKSRTGGFYGNSERARLYGSLGGKLSTRNGRKRSLEEQARIRKAFEKNYAHLLAIHKASKHKRQVSE